MNRRELLASAAALAAGGLAGCLAGAPGDDGSDGDPDTDAPTDTIEPTATAEATETSALSASSFTVDEIASADPEDRASLTYDDGTVVVDGTIVGNNGCYTARLQDATYEGGTLTVTVQSYEEEGSGACTQALVAIDYTATVRFAGRTADEVVVRHARNGEVSTVLDTRE